MLYEYEKEVQIHLNLSMATAFLTLFVISKAYTAAFCFVIVIKEILKSSTFFGRKNILELCLTTPFNNNCFLYTEILNAFYHLIVLKYFYVVDKLASVWLIFD